jgi:hypothetical protein
VLIHQLADFKNLIQDRKVVSFYEREQTRQLVFVIVGPRNNSGADVDPIIGLGKPTIETNRRLYHNGRHRLSSSLASRSYGGQSASRC